MIFARKQSTTTYPIQFPMRDSAGALQTGKTVSISISKNGGSFGSASGAVTEIGSSGVYSWAGNATDRNTIGELRVTATATGCDATDFTLNIVAYDPFNEVNANVTQWLGNAVTWESTASRPAVAVTHWNEYAVNSTGIGATNYPVVAVLKAYDSVSLDYDYLLPASGGGGLDAAGVRAAVGLASANLDTQLGTIDTVVDAIKAKTDNLPADPADASDIATEFSTVNSTLATIAGYIDTEIGTLQTSVNDLPTNSELTTALSGLATASALSTVEGKVDTVDGVVDAIKAVTDTIVPLYTAQIEFAKDTANSRDEYTVKWLKNGVPQTSGITTPLIKVTKRDNTDLVAETAMTNVGSGNLIYNEATNRQTAGESYIITVTATIDGTARPFTKVTGRDV